MRKSRKKFICLDCSKDTSKMGELYMLVDNIWEIINPFKHGMLCIKCAESRLGRNLNKRDFNRSYLNSSKSFNRSMLLIQRLGK